MQKIALHSVPRSGSTWVGSIFDSHPEVAYRFQPLFSYGHKGQISVNSDESDINNFFEDILNTSDEFVLRKEAILKNKVLDFNKKDIAHVVYKEVRYHHILKNLLARNNDVKVVGLLRSPFSVISSWLNAPKEFRKHLRWKAEDEWKDAPKKNLNLIEEYNGYNKWKEVTFLFQELKYNYPNRFYLLNYDDLIGNTELEIKKLFQFCGLEFTLQTKDFIKQSTSKNSDDAYAVFKQKTNDLDWQGQLPTYIVEEIKKDKDFQKLNKKFKWI